MSSTRIRYPEPAPRRSHDNLQWDGPHFPPSKRDRELNHYPHQRNAWPQDGYGNPDVYWRGRDPPYEDDRLKPAPYYRQEINPRRHYSPQPYGRSGGPMYYDSDSRVREPEHHHHHHHLQHPYDPRFHTPELDPRSDPRTYRRHSHASDYPPRQASPASQRAAEDAYFRRGADFPRRATHPVDAKDEQRPSSRASFRSTNHSISPSRKERRHAEELPKHEPEHTPSHLRQELVDTDDENDEETEDLDDDSEAELVIPEPRHSSTDSQKEKSDPMYKHPRQGEVASGHATYDSAGKERSSNDDLSKPTEPSVNESEIPSSHRRSHGSHSSSGSERRQSPLRSSPPRRHSPERAQQQSTPPRHESSELPRRERHSQAYESDSDCVSPTSAPRQRQHRRSDQEPHHNSQSPSRRPPPSHQERPQCPQPSAYAANQEDHKQRHQPESNNVDFVKNLLEYAVSHKKGAHMGEEIPEMARDMIRKCLKDLQAGKLDLSVKGLLEELKEVMEGDI